MSVLEKITALAETGDDQLVPNGKDFEVKLSYQKGGTNYMNLQQERRGFYLQVACVVVTQHDGYISRKISPLEKCNFKIYLSNENNPPKRISQKAKREALEKLQKLLANGYIQSIL